MRLAVVVLAVLVAGCHAFEPEVDPDGGVAGNEVEEEEEEEEEDAFEDAEIDGEPIPFDGLTKRQRQRCKKEKYVKRHYNRCCGLGKFRYREEICEKLKPPEDPDLRTTAYPKLQRKVSDRCTACARMVDNFDLGLLPRLRERQKQISKGYKTRRSKSSSMGDLEAIVEEEVSHICQWPRTHHSMPIRRACYGLVEDKDEEIVDAISKWARTKLANPKWMAKHDRMDRAATRLHTALPGVNHSEYDATTEKFMDKMSHETNVMLTAARKSAPMKKSALKSVKRMAQAALPGAEQKKMITEGGEPADGSGTEVFDMSKAVAADVGMARDDELISEFRPALCVKALMECTDYDMYELETQDADERAKLSHAALTGINSNNPLESDIPDQDVQTGPLTFVVASDFVRRVTVWGKQTDFLIWMQFPGRWNVTDDTHAKLRPKWMKMAQLLDPKASNGSFEVAWIDCVFNQLPFPHGMHITEDTVALYAAGEDQKRTPKYMTNLQGGDIHIREIINFLFEASTNIATKDYLAKKMAEIGDDMLQDGIKYPTFVESLTTEEKWLLPDNTSKLREEYDHKRSLPAPGRKELEEMRRALPLPPHEELMQHHGLDKHGNDLLAEKNKWELR